MSNYQRPSETGLIAPPNPTPIGPFPFWIPLVGALFGGITLIGLLVLVWVAGQNATFVCNSFPIIAFVFALGAALAASFIGGSAAFQGKFGELSNAGAIVITAGGGAGVLMAVYVLTNVFKPTDCPVIENLTRDKASLETQVKQYTATTNTLTRDKTALEAQVKQYEESNGAVTRDNTALKTQVKQFAEANEALTRAKLDLDQDFSKFRASNQSARGAMNGLRLVTQTPS